MGSFLVQQQPLKLCHASRGPGGVLRRLRACGGLLVGLACVWVSSAHALDVNPQPQSMQEVQAVGGTLDQALAGAQCGGWDTTQYVALPENPQNHYPAAKDAAQFQKRVDMEDAVWQKTAANQWVSQDKPGTVLTDDAMDHQTKVVLGKIAYVSGLPGHRGLWDGDIQSGLASRRVQPLPAASDGSRPFRFWTEGLVDGKQAFSISGEGVLQASGQAVFTLDGGGKGAGSLGGGGTWNAQGPGIDLAGKGPVNGRGIVPYEGTFNGRKFSKGIVTLGFDTFGPDGFVFPWQVKGLSTSCRLNDSPQVAKTVWRTPGGGADSDNEPVSLTKVTLPNAVITDPPCLPGDASCQQYCKALNTAFQYRDCRTVLTVTNPNGSQTTTCCEWCNRYTCTDSWVDATCHNTCPVSNCPNQSSSSSSASSASSSQGFTISFPSSPSFSSSVSSSDSSQFQIILPPPTHISSAPPVPLFFFCNPQTGACGQTPVQPDGITVFPTQEQCTAACQGILNNSPAPTIPSIKSLGFHWLSSWLTAQVAAPAQADKPPRSPDYEWQNCTVCVGDTCRCPSGNCTLVSQQPLSATMMRRIKCPGGKDGQYEYVVDSKGQPQGQTKKYKSFYRVYDAHTDRESLPTVGSDQTALKATAACYGWYDEFDPLKVPTQPQDKRCTVDIAFDLAQRKLSQRGKGEYALNAACPQSDMPTGIGGSSPAVVAQAETRDGRTMQYALFSCDGGGITVYGSQDRCSWKGIGAAAAGCDPSVVLFDGGDGPFYYLFSTTGHAISISRSGTLTGPYALFAPNIAQGSHPSAVVKDKRLMLWFMAPSSDTAGMGRLALSMSADARTWTAPQSSDLDLPPANVAYDALAGRFVLAAVEHDGQPNARLVSRTSFNGLSWSRATVLCDEDCLPDAAGNVHLSVTRAGHLISSPFVTYGVGGQVYEAPLYRDSDPAQWFSQRGKGAFDALKDAWYQRLGGAFSFFNPGQDAVSVSDVVSSGLDTAQMRPTVEEAPLENRGPFGITGVLGDAGLIEGNGTWVSATDFVLQGDIAIKGQRFSFSNLAGQRSPNGSVQLASQEQASVSLDAQGTWSESDGVQDLQGTVTAESIGDLPFGGGAISFDTPPPNVAQPLQHSDLTRAFDETGKHVVEEWWQKQQTVMDGLVHRPIARILLPPSLKFELVNALSSVLQTRPQPTPGRDPRSEPVEIQVNASEDFLGLTIEALRHAMRLPIEEEPMNVVVPMGDPTAFRALAQQWCAWLTNQTGADCRGDTGKTGISGPVGQLIDRLNAYALQIEQVRWLRSQLADEATDILNLQQQALGPLNEWVADNGDVYQQYRAQQRQLADSLLPAWQTAENLMAGFHEATNAPWCMDQRFTPVVPQLLDPWLASRMLGNGPPAPPPAAFDTEGNPHPGYARKAGPITGDGLPDLSTIAGIPSPQTFVRPHDILLDFSRLRVPRQPLKLPVLHVIQVRLNLPQPPQDAAALQTNPLPDLPSLQPVLDAVRAAKKDLPITSGLGGSLPVQFSPGTLPPLQLPALPDQATLQTIGATLGRIVSLLQVMDGTYREFWTGLAPDAQTQSKIFQTVKQHDCPSWATSPCTNVEMNLVEELTRFDSRPLVGLPEDRLPVALPRSFPGTCLPDDESCSLLPPETVTPRRQWAVQIPPAAVFQQQNALDALRTALRKLTFGPPLGNAPASLPFDATPTQRLPATDLPPPVELRVSP